MTDEEIKQLIENKGVQIKIGDTFTRKYQDSSIVYTDAHHDCFSRSIYNRYAIIQAMFLGYERNQPMFLVEYVYKDYFLLHPYEEKV